MTEDEMIGWHHQLDGHEFDQAVGVGDGQKNLCVAVHGMAKNQTPLSDSTVTNYKGPSLSKAFTLGTFFSF